MLAKDDENFNFHDTSRLYIVKCNKQVNPYCKEDDVIDRFLQTSQLRLKLHEERPKFAKNTTLYYETQFVKEVGLQMGL
jgi:hypothetical protein